MKTDLYLLMLTDGNPLMSIEKVSDLTGLNKRTIENRIYDQTFPIPMFKLAGATWHAHVADVAKYIDKQRAGATDLLQQARKAA